MARKRKQGKITMQIGAEPTESDITVANIFARLGVDVEFIASSKAYLVHTPDINMEGLDWEIKCIESSKVDKVRRNISKALDQSVCIILGTFATDIPDEKIIRYINNHVLPKKKNIKRLKVITKAHLVVDIK